MTTLESNRNEAEGQTPAHTYEVVAGYTYRIKASDIFTAEREARETLKAKLGDDHDTPENNAIIATVVQEINGVYRWLKLPDGMGAGEAKQLFDWALQQADRTRIDWDSLAFEIEDDDDYQEVRNALMNLSPSVFSSWLCDDSGLVYNYQATIEELTRLADLAEEAYLGEYDNSAEFAQEYYEEAGELTHLPPEVADAIDWEQVYDTALCYDVTEIRTPEGRYYFRNY